LVVLFFSMKEEKQSHQRLRQAAYSSNDND
jgi:hypothetical protein